MYGLVLFEKTIILSNVLSLVDLQLTFFHTLITVKLNFDNLITIVHRLMKMVLFHLTNHGSTQYQIGSQQGTFGQELEWPFHHFGVIMTYVEKEQ